MNNTKKRVGFFAILTVIILTTFITLACDNGNTSNTTTTQSVAKPIAAPAGGNYTAVQTVSLTTTIPDAEIYYTINGTTPRTDNISSTKYSSAITISETTTLKAIAIKSGMNNSEILTESYTINLPIQPVRVVKPTAAPAGGNYTSSQTVTLTTTMPDAAIFYTFDGSNPTTGSSFYSTAITINNDTTLKAVAMKTGLVDSEILTETYIIGSTTIIPDTPINVTVTAQTISSSILITWNMSSFGGIPTSYNIWRSTSSSGTYTEIGNVSGTTNTFTDTGLSGNTYYYRVDAQNSTGKSLLSSPVPATIEDFPGSPRNVIATAQSMSSIRITWNAPLYGGTPSSYYIWRSTSSSGTYTEIGNVSGTTTSYMDTGLNASTRYFYRVDARNSAGRSESSPVSGASATTDSNPLVPGVPTSVSATALTPASVRVTWNAPTSGATPTWYNIWRSTSSSGTYTLVGYVSGTTTSYINTGLNNNVSYYYRVDAENSAGTSPQSSSVWVLTPIIKSTLANGVWHSTITSSWIHTEGDFFSFTIVNGTTYRIWVDDKDNYSGTQTADVVIQAYYSNGTQIWSSQQDRNWDTPAFFTANSNGTVYIRVDPYSSTSTGTYRIVYSTGTTRP
ncbi:MAG: chitobiase/beta-hexosaminidase C-terminal domain-containing protein [Treponema sp.]|nr:chitobiase/beta-hexosaminidase C-terminal domain-containing protein [Treponema sp.]